MTLEEMAKASPSNMKTPEFRARFGCPFLKVKDELIDLEQGCPWIIGLLSRSFSTTGHGGTRWRNCNSKQ